MSTKQHQALADRAAVNGWTLEHNDTGHRLVTTTGTLVAGVWTNPDGYGLTLNDIEAVLDGTYQPTSTPADTEANPTDPVANSDT